jgi:hypothetical protein
MFDQFGDLPLHALVIHAAVVLTPLTAVLGIAFAAVRPWRWLLRWPLVASAVLALGAVFVSVQSGKVFRERIEVSDQIIHSHAEAGELLLNAMYGYVVLAAVAALALGGPSALRSGKGARSGLAGPVQAVVAVVLVVGSLAVSYQVYKTGDSGARAVWGFTAD